MGAGNPYSPSCHSYYCRDTEINNRNNVCYVLKTKGIHMFKDEMKPWFHQSVGNPIVEEETYWACEDCINHCPFKGDFKYVKEYKVRGLMS